MAWDVSDQTTQNSSCTLLSGETKMRFPVPMGRNFVRPLNENQACYHQDVYFGSSYTKQQQQYLKELKWVEGGGARTDGLVPGGSDIICVAKWILTLSLIW